MDERDITYLTGGFGVGAISMLLLILLRQGSYIVTGKGMAYLLACEKALRELVYLKRHKDKNGDTPEYLERKPKAWEAAFNATADDKSSES